MRTKPSTRAITHAFNHSAGHPSRLLWRFGLARLLALLLVALTVPALAGTYHQGNRTWDYEPVRWEHFVPVEGQELPVPEQWLQDEEARIVHNLKLPDSVPKSVPFDFDSVEGWRSWLPGKLQ